MASLMKQILSEQARQSIPALDPSVAIAWLKGEITQGSKGLWGRSRCWSSRDNAGPPASQSATCSLALVRSSWSYRIVITERIVISTAASSWHATPSQ